MGVLEPPATKDRLGALAMALKGIQRQDFIDTVELYRAMTGARTLKLIFIGHICGWLRRYTVRQIHRGMEAGKAASERIKALDHSRGTILSPRWFDQHIAQFSNLPSERELRVGGQR